MRGGLLHHRQRVPAGGQEVEEEGGGRVWRHTHGLSTEQDRPHLTVRDRPVGINIPVYILHTHGLSTEQDRTHLTVRENKV